MKNKLPSRNLYASYKKMLLLKTLNTCRNVFINLFNIEHTVKQSDNMLPKPQTVINNKVYLVAENIFIFLLLIQCVPNSEPNRL